MEEKYCTVKEASDLLNITEQVVRNYIHLGKLKSKKVFNSTVISEKEIRRYTESIEK